MNETESSQQSSSEEGALQDGGASAPGTEASASEASATGGFSGAAPQPDPTAGGLATTVANDGEEDEDEGGEELDRWNDPERRVLLKKALESLIFVSDRIITHLQLARIVQARAALVRTVLAELVEEYQERGVQLVELAGGYQFRTAPDTGIFVRELVAQKPVRLTRAQLETLALVAYRQPITRPEVDEVRGVDTGAAIKVLLDRGLVKMLGRKDEAGRPLLYGTTPFFLEFFGLRSLKELPTLKEFTELSEDSRTLFKRKTGESVEAVERELAPVEDDGERGASTDTDAEGQAPEADAETSGAELTEQPDGDSDPPSDPAAEDPDPELEPEREDDEFESDDLDEASDDLDEDTQQPLLDEDEPMADADDPEDQPAEPVRRTDV